MSQHTLHSSLRLPTATHIIHMQDFAIYSNFDSDIQSEFDQWMRCRLYDMSTYMMHICIVWCLMNTIDRPDLSRIQNPCLKYICHNMFLWNNSFILIISFKFKFFISNLKFSEYSITFRYFVIDIDIYAEINTISLNIRVLCKVILLVSI